MSTNPSASIVVVEGRDTPYFEAKFRYQGRQVKRGADGWRARRGQVQQGFYDERRAHVAAAEIVAAYVADAREVEHHGAPPGVCAAR
jgi:hypothetical protein